MVNFLTSFSLTHLENAEWLPDKIKIMLKIGTNENNLFDSIASFSLLSPPTICSIKSSDTGGGGQSKSWKIPADNGRPEAYVSVSPHGDIVVTSTDRQYAEEIKVLLKKELTERGITTEDKGIIFQRNSPESS